MERVLSTCCVGEPEPQIGILTYSSKEVMRPFCVNLFIIVMLATLTVPSTAQQVTRFSVPLRINQDADQFIAHLIASRKHLSSLVYTFPVSNDLGQAPGGTLLQIQQVDDSTHAYKVTVDLDGDRKLDNDSPQLVMPNSSITVRVNRRFVDGRQMMLPYIISYSREPDQSGQPRERFTWSSHYRAEGKLKIKNCEALIVLLDLTSDGLFDSADSAKGTNIGLDRNGDGRVWGQGEYFTGQEIIEFCGESFLIGSFAVDGTSVELEKTELRVPRVGDQLPAFSLTTIAGTKINSKDLSNKVHLLDFWASWCKPCVEKFDLVKKLSEEFKQQDLSIIAINVDEESRVPMAREIIRDYKLQWPQVMYGRGEDDSLWKMFGTIGENHLNIPLYVLVDAQGRLRYVGNGGEGLEDLRSEIKRLIKSYD